MPNSPKDVVALETQIFELKQQLAKLRQGKPRTPAGKYEFKSHEGGTTDLAGLFGDKDDLIVVHNMGTGCTYCTLWADGFNSVTDHLANRAAFVVTSPDPVERQKQFASSRSWGFKMVSSEGNRFFKDMGFEEVDGDFWPGVSTFHREPDGSVTHVASATFGPGDEYCAVWSLFDLLAGGAGEWEPQYKYK